MTYATTNPYSGEVLKTFPNATDAEVDQAIAAAHAAFVDAHVRQPRGGRLVVARPCHGLA